MRHAIVTRVVWSVCALCVGAAMLFAYVVTAPTSQAENKPAQPAPAAPPSGEALFDQFCSGCHNVAEAEGMLRRGGVDLNANARAMTDFLKTHGGANEEQNRLIVEFFRGRTK